MAPPPKSRADKASKTYTTPAPTITQDIIPGKFNDRDWNFMLDTDDNEEFVYEITEEIVENALDLIFKGYIGNQLIPFTVAQAKEALLDLIEWRFLQRDEGEIAVEWLEEEESTGERPNSPKQAWSMWTEDEEPPTPVPDCWAQGVVPVEVRRLSSARSQKEESITGEVVEDIENAKAHIPSIQEETKEEVEREDAEAIEKDTRYDEEEEETKLDDNQTLEEDENAVLEPKSPVQDRRREDRKKADLKKRRKAYKPHHGSLPKANAGLTETLDQTEDRLRFEEVMKYVSGIERERSINDLDPKALLLPLSAQSLIKLQGGRPPATRDVFYDDYGNVIGVTKIKPEQLPSHKVNVKVKVTDPSMAKQRKFTRKTESSLVNTSFDEKTLNATTASSKKPIGNTLLETIDVAPGVLVKEGDRIKKGPKQNVRRTNQGVALEAELRPIETVARVPITSVKEILDHQSPVVKPLPQTPPIPPIPSSASYTSDIY